MTKHNRTDHGRSLSVLLVALATVIVTVVTGGCAPQPVGDLVPVVLGNGPVAPPGPGDAVALRSLVIATDADDVGLATWRSILDRVGTPYDVILARTEPLDADRLVRPDGVGRYSAVLLSSSALLFEDGADFRSALSPEQWYALWDYEKTFGVRQVAINGSPGTFPEDYCLRPRSEDTVDGTPVEAELTAAGGAVFDHLRPGARLPLTDTYLYRSTLAPNCPAEALLTVDSDVVGVLSTAPDGRERLAVTMIVGPEQLSTDLLAHGLLRWATRGVFVGEQRYHINVDVDDWFLPTARRRADGSIEPYRLTGAESESVARQQDALREKYPLAGDLTLNLAFNGSVLDPTAPAECDPTGPADDLSGYSRCLAREFRWLNHTFSHPEMNTTSYEESRSQISDNLERAAAAGLAVPADILKTPEYSGLGVYTDDSAADSSQPTDHGLAGSNRALLRAAAELGVRYLHGNMSFASHRPACFNCGTYHPLEPGILVVPDWPVNISFESITPEDQTAAFAALHGAPGRTLTYEQIIDHEATVALRHITSGSAYAHTLHQGNLHEYRRGRSLTFDWLDAVVGKYSDHFAVPLENPDWPTLAAYVEARTAHFAELAAAHDAVWDRARETVSYAPARTGTLFVTGIATRAATTGEPAGLGSARIYGRDPISQLSMTAGETVRFGVRPRP